MNVKIQVVGKTHIVQAFPAGREFVFDDVLAIDHQQLC